MRISIEFKNLSKDELSTILAMKAEGRIICRTDAELLEEVGSGYHIPTSTYDIGWTKE